MRNPKFKRIVPNYRKNVLEITLQEGKKTTSYNLPFVVFRKQKIGINNRIVSITIDHELGNQAASLLLENGAMCDFPADFVLYHCDATYDWSPINQLKKSLKDTMVISRLSIRTLADALNTSPSQVVRLLKENRTSKQWLQLFQLAELMGYQIALHLKKKGTTAWDDLIPS